jgi:uncharacterized membrane protein
MTLMRGRCLALLVATPVAAVCYWTNWDSPIRVAIMLVFLLFLPGLAIAEFARVPDALERLVVALGASLALETLVAVAFLYAGLFTPGRVLFVVLVSTATVAAVAAIRVPRPA